MNDLPELPLLTGVLLGLGIDCTGVELLLVWDSLKKSTSLSSGLEAA